MRVLAALLVASTTLAAQTTTTRKPSTTHRPVATSPRLPLPADTPIDPHATEGLAAVGTMPAVTGTPSSLYALKYVDLKIGEGELAKPSTPPSDVVFYTVHYTGWLLDGTKFDSSVDRGEPIVFPIGLRRVIAGWDTGFEGMRVGGKRRLIVPYQLAYGAAGHPPTIPEKATLVFDVELVGQGNTQQPVTGSQFGTPTPSAPKPAQRPEEHQE